MTTHTPKRKNNPELLRHNLLICAKNLILREGIANLSMQKVADMADTSKGGLFHHFKSKEELIDGVFELFIAQINTAILEYIHHHTPKQDFGTFTKAYIHVMFDNADIGLNSDWAGIIHAMTADERLNALWTNWLQHKLTQYKDTDDDIRLHAVRYAVDGAWLNGAKDDELIRVKDYLLTLIHSCQ